MKKVLTFILSLTVLFSLCIGVQAQTYTPGMVYVEGKNKAFGNGDSITIKRGETFHIARLTPEKEPLTDDDFWYSCWNPLPLIESGFIFSDEGSSFADNEALWGPILNTSNVKAGTYTLNFYLSSAKDVEENLFSGAMQYDPLSIRIKIVKNPQTLKIETVKKNVKLAKVQDSAYAVSPIKSITGAHTALRFEKVSGSRYLTVKENTGKVVIKKNTPKGTYTVKIRVIAAANAMYKQAEQTITASIVIQ